MKIFNRILIFTISLLIVITETNYNALAQTTESVRYYPTTCRLTRRGSEYAGSLNRTVNNRTCQAWNSHEPHYNYFTNEHNEYPEGNSTAAGNKCRNPEIGHTEGVWCYTTDPNKRWEACDVKFCECKLYSDPKGIKYQGQIATTTAGRTCQRWTSRSPNNHPYYNKPAMFPDQTVSEAMNYCRNPNSSRDGLWCYTTDRNVPWEYCFIPVCYFSIPVTTGETTTTSTPSTTPTPSSTTTPRPTIPEVWTNPPVPTLSGIIWNSPTPTASSGASNLGSLLGGIFGTITIILIILLVVFFVQRRPDVLINIRNQLSAATNKSRSIFPETVTGGDADVASPSGLTNDKQPSFDNPIYDSPKNSHIVRSAGENNGAVAEGGRMSADTAVNFSSLSRVDFA